MKKQPKFMPAQIIGTHREYPHMVLRVVEDGTYINIWYTVLDLTTGRKDQVLASWTDRECLPIEELTEEFPLAFDGHFRLKDANLAYIA